MKAQINGVTVEGTPEEILEYQSLVEMKNKEVLSKKLNVTVHIDSDKIEWDSIVNSINKELLSMEKLHQKQFGY